MRNFARFDGGRNLPGYVHFYFIEDSNISSLPIPVDGVVDLDDAVYPASDEWHVGAAILKTLALGNELKKNADGPNYPVVIEGKSALKSAWNLQLFHEMGFKRWIVLIKDLNGNYFICGEPGNGLQFVWKEIDGGLSFTFSGAYKQPCWFATGDVNIDSLSVGINYIPVSTIILGQDGKSAYEIAVENGFVGTEEEWLASLDSSISFISAYAGM
jgi:hypothetical protein